MCKLQDADAAARKRSRRKFWRMLLFSLFLIYPGVSSVVLRLFVCTKIQDTYYLRADFRLECYTTEWSYYAITGIFFIAMYPIGIPLFFMYMMKRYRYRLHEDGVKAELGFLYDAYDHEVWWFELADMLHKLSLTSLIAFAGIDAQLKVGAAITTVYTITILCVRPYKRKGDDRLHLLAQAEILLLLVVGLTFHEKFDNDESVDIAMSVVLIISYLLFHLVFAVQVGRSIRKLIRMRREKRRQRLVDQEKKGKAPIVSGNNLMEQLEETNEIGTSARSRQETGEYSAPASLSNMQSFHNQLFKERT